jgi:hypothetical protein
LANNSPIYSSTFGKKIDFSADKPDRRPMTNDQ